MSNEQSQAFAREWLKGVADFIGTTFSETATIEPDQPEPLAAEGLEGLLEKCPVVFTANPSVGGSVAVLLPEALAAHIATLAGAEGGEDATIDDTRLAALKEIAGLIMAAGAGAVADLTGQEFEVESGDAAVLSPGDAQQFAGNFGAMDAAAYTWTFDSGTAGEGMIAWSASVVDALGGGSAHSDPLVSDDEMKDILSGFDTDEGATQNGDATPQEDYGVILDIELTAMARLGSMEMPISEILNLVPGSILEVGHMVDEPIELLVNNKLVARGDVVVVDEKFGLRITEIVSQKERIESLR